MPSVIQISVINTLVRWGVMIAGLFLAVYVSYGFAATEGNSLAEVAKLAVFVGFIFGMILPRPMFYIMAFMTVTLDLLKRCLVIFGNVNFLDVAYVLAISPFTLAGIFTGIILHRLFQGKLFSRFETALLALTTIMLGIFLTKAIMGGNGLLGSGKLVVEGSSYAFLAMIVSLLLPTERAIVRYLDLIIYLFCAVAFYGIYQYIFGLQPLEIEYMKSGLTGSIKELYDLHPRPFSTLNSAHSFSIMMAMMAVLSFARAYLSFRYDHHVGVGFVFVVMFVIFGVALGLSLGRTAWVLGIAGMCCLWFYLNRWRTLIFYVTAVGLYLFIVFNAEDMIKNLSYYQSLLPQNSDFTKMAFRVTTYYDRLLGFSNMTRSPDFWTAFGSEVEIDKFIKGGPVYDDRYTHDAIGRSLITYGYVPVGLALLLIAITLVWVHGRIFSLKIKRRRFLVTALLSIIFATFGTGLLSGGHTTIYPINFVFWVMIGAIICLVRLPDDDEAGLEEKSPKEPASGNSLSL